VSCLTLRCFISVWKQIALKRSGAPINILTSITQVARCGHGDNERQHQGMRRITLLREGYTSSLGHAIRGAPFTDEEIRELLEEYQGAGNGQT